MKTERISFLYRKLVIASLLIGILLNLKNTMFIEFLLSYYTMWSNLLCLVFFLFLEIKKHNDQEKNWYYILKGEITMAILLTFVIYLVGLLPKNLPMYHVSPFDRGITSKQVANILVHIVSPLLVVGDYYFDKKGNLKYYYPVIWLIFPSLYVSFVYSGKGKFYGIGGSRKYAYYFLDYEKLGIHKVMLYIAGIAIAIIVVGIILVFLDKKLAKRKFNN